MTREIILGTRAVRSYRRGEYRVVCAECGTPKHPMRFLDYDRARRAAALDAGKWCDDCGARPAALSCSPAQGGPPALTTLRHE